jgi:hypothetical protein
MSTVAGRDTARRGSLRPRTLTAKRLKVTTILNADELLAAHSARASSALACAFACPIAP